MVLICKICGMTAKKEENGDESLYADKTYQVKVNMSRDCITKHIFVGDTRIASRVTFNDLTHSDNEEIRGVYYYHPDHLGNTTFVSDYRGEEYQHLEYTPYGETWVEESDNNKYINYKFTGKELDEETGLYYFGARYYDPKTSTWASCDPILGDYLPVAPVSDDAKNYNQNLPGMGGIFNPINLNLYCYAGNNPIKYVDPDGKELTIKFYVIEIEKVDNGHTAKGFLMVTDNDTGKQELYITAWSGGIDHGEPIPFGKYDILEKTDIGYRLEANDSN